MENGETIKEVVEEGYMYPDIGERDKMNEHNMKQCLQEAYSIWPVLHSKLNSICKVRLCNMPPVPLMRYRAREIVKRTRKFRTTNKSDISRLYVTRTDGRWRSMFCGGSVREFESSLASSVKIYKHEFIDAVKMQGISKENEVVDPTIFKRKHSEQTTKYIRATKCTVCA